MGQTQVEKAGMWPFKYHGVGTDHLHVFVHSHTASGANNNQHEQHHFLTMPE
jgi:hypothetical protein